jgi:hypothetical protein
MKKILITIAFVLISIPSLASEKNNYTIYDNQYNTKGYIYNGKIYDRDYKIEGYVKDNKVYDRGYKQQGSYERTGGNKGRGKR